MPKKAGALKRILSTLAVALLAASVSTETFDGWGRYEVTAYSHHCIMPKSGKESKKKFKGANGQWPVPNLTIAADKSLPFGTVMVFAHRGISTERIVGDRGRSIKGRRIDLFVENCRMARRWGRKILYGKIVAIPAK